MSRYDEIVISARNKFEALENKKNKAQHNIQENQETSNENNPEASSGLEARYLEKIIGNNEMLDISFLKRGLELAKSVCRIYIKYSNSEKGFATGFLVHPQLIMTNHHVFRSANEAIGQLAEFGYELNKKGQPKTSYFFRFRPDKFFITHKELDYTVLAAESFSSNAPKIKLKDFGWNKLKRLGERILIPKRVSIIQHPKGEYKKIAIRENEVVENDDTHIYYLADTEKGSSGSPVTNDQWDIVALHRAGFPYKDKYGNMLLKHGVIWKSEDDNAYIINKHNQGVIMDRILHHIYYKQIQLTKDQEELKKQLLSAYYPDQEWVEEYKLPK